MKGYVFMKEKLLEAAERIVQSKGFSALTFQDIADEVGLRKPSVFHHIKNKEELALLLIERCGSKHGVDYEQVVGRKLPAPDKLRQIANIFERGLLEDRLCLIASISHGAAMLSDHARKALQDASSTTITLFARVFEQGRKEGTLTFEGSNYDAALCFFAMLQGLQSLTRASNNTSSFGNATDTYINSISN